MGFHHAKVTLQRDGTGRHQDHEAGNLGGAFELATLDRAGANVVLQAQQDSPVAERIEPVAIHFHIGTHDLLCKIAQRRCVKRDSRFERVNNGVVAMAVQAEQEMCGKV